jgi:hypothetical protein
LIQFKVKHKNFERCFNFAVHVTVRCLHPAPPHPKSVVHMTAKLKASKSTS